MISGSDLSLQVEADSGTGKASLLEEEAVAGGLAAPPFPRPASVQAEEDSESTEVWCPLEAVKPQLLRHHCNRGDGAQLQTQQRQLGIQSQGPA